MRKPTKAEPEELQKHGQKSITIMITFLMN